MVAGLMVGELEASLELEHLCQIVSGGFGGPGLNISTIGHEVPSLLRQDVGFVFSIGQLVGVPIVFLSDHDH